ncbi:Ger(x)C family spore germination protein [Paenisporosarcina sp.]|uniref:Ger(x)C family spore germination protein n=1 Tax=Paenisporosarcina sp. TaxID=1932001 RepID=UPI003C715E27
MRKRLSILMSALLLGGCWDERQYKDYSVVSMVGHEGKVGELTSYFSVPSIKDGVTTSIIVKGEGKSTRDARMEADLKANQTIDVSKLSVLLYSDESVKSDLYEFLDVYYRNAENQLSTYIAISEGSPEPYIELGNQLQDEAGTYYKKFIESLVYTSIYPETDLQLVCSLLFDDAIDLTLPYISINKEANAPEIKGLALFNGRKYTGTYLTVNQSKVLTVLKDKAGRRANFTYTYKDTPITMVIRKIDKKWDYSEIDKSGIVTLSYKLKADVQEFSRDHIEQGENRKELEQFLSEQLNNETKKLFEVLQEAKSDPLGLGRRVRAFHPEVWEKGDWNDTFSEITIKPDIKVDIKRTGILK